MRNFSHQIKFILAFSGLFCLLTAIAVTNTVTADEAGTVSNTISHSPTSEISSEFLSSEGVDRSITAETTEYVSPEFTADYEFNGVGLTWDGASTAQVEFYVKVDNGEWIELELVGDEAKDTFEQYATFPVFVTGNTIQYKITGEVEHIQNIKITYFNSTTAPEVSPLASIQSGLRKITSSNDVNIISREEWGADESYQFWSPTYIQPKKFIIHHTAGGDGGSDPAATVRGIYYWHAVVLGWGDIGYNYLVDQEGNIYEGRYGSGDAPESTIAAGAHAYNSIDNLDYNQYTVGIAVLGCFEEGTACATTYEFSSVIQNTLAKLIAVKADEFGIKPKGSSTLFGERTKNILGHRDLDYTLCPGNLIHDDIKTIRDKAQKRYKLLSNETTQPYKGDFISNTFTSTMVQGSTPSVTVQYSNIGSKTWKSDEVVMQVRILDKSIKQRVLLTEDVAADTTATISFTWLEMPTKAGEYTVSTRLYRHGHPIRGTNNQYQITITNP